MALPTPGGTRPAPQALKIMNYYPSSGPWGLMWTAYDHSVIDSDFARIHTLGANTVRVIVPPNSVGYPNVSASGASELNDIITTAAANGLYVQLTLFDAWKGYALVAQSEQWVSQLLAPYLNDARIALVEVQNEISVTDPTAMAWARQMIDFLPTILPNVPRTVSIAGAQDAASMTALNAAIPATSMEVVDVHLYGGLASAKQKMLNALAIAAGRPVIVGEAGQSTGANISTCKEQDQLRFYQQTILAAAQLGIPTIAPWTLTDLAQATLPTLYQGTSQAGYGLSRLDGTWKPSAAVVRAMFGAPSPSSVSTMTALEAKPIAPATDGGFECEASTLPSSPTGTGAWTAFASDLAKNIGIAPGQGVNGTVAGYISGAGSSTSRVPSITQELPVLGRTSVTLSAQIRLVAASGFTRLAIAYFKNGTYLGQTESAGATLVGSWQTLSVTAPVPAGATTFQIHLKSQKNVGTAYFDNVTVS